MILCRHVKLIRMFKSLPSVVCVYGLLLLLGFDKIGKSVLACVLGGFPRLDQLKEL